MLPDRDRAFSKGYDLKRELNGDRSLFLLTLLFVLCTCISCGETHKFSYEVEDNNGLLTNADRPIIHDEECFDSLIIYRSQGDGLRIVPQPITPNVLKVTVYGVFGSLFSENERYLIIREGKENKTSSEPDSILSVSSDQISFTLLFNDLNLGIYPYTIAFATPFKLTKTDSVFNYSASVSFKYNKDLSKDSLFNYQSVNITPIAVAGEVFRCTYFVPQGNNPSKQGDYLVIFEGKMSPDFNGFKRVDLVGEQPVLGTYGGGAISQNVILSKEVKHGSIYTLAYLNGNDTIEGPNFKGLVAWREFLMP